MATNMSKSRNDYRRKYYDDNDDYYGDRFSKERNRLRQEKKMSNALRSKNIDALYELDDD
jgi:hypothetical protein